jgi:hypothetical protein
MTTIKTRLGRLEAARSGRAVVLAWLEEAQAYPSLTAYARSTLEGRGSERPLGRILREVRANTLAATPKRSLQATNWVFDRAIREAFLTYEVVRVLNASTREFTQLARLQMIAGQLLGEKLTRIVSLPDLPMAERDPATDPFLLSCGHWIATARDLLVERKVELAARLELERRYLGGHGALFGDLRQAFAELGPLAVGLAEVVAHLAGCIPRSVVPAPSAASFEERVEARVSDLFDQARMAAYRHLGDDVHAAAIEERRLRAGIASELGSDANAPVAAEPDAGAWSAEGIEPAGEPVLRRGRWHHGHRHGMPARVAAPPRGGS